MEESKNPNPIIDFFTNLFAGFKLPFAQDKNGVVEESTVVVPEAPAVKVVKEDESKAPVVVTFPKKSFETVKLEAEADDAQRSTNPMLLWQVYAIGGFLIIKWGWTRWNERKAKKKKDDEPPPAPTQD